MRFLSNFDAEQRKDQEIKAGRIVIQSIRTWPYLRQTGENMRPWREHETQGST